MKKQIIVSIAKVIAPLFFEKTKYLTGHYFDTSKEGWIWVAKALWFQKILGFNRSIPWPVSPHVKISNFRNISFSSSSLNNFQSFGIYFQNFNAKITLGENVYIAPNVGLITANHDPCNPAIHLAGKDIQIDDNCWIGMNAVILPGVHLGKGTIVAAGAVVTKSFSHGNIVLAGVPARILRKLDC